MRYVFEDRAGNEIEFSQDPCESMKEGLTQTGVILGGKFMTCGEYDAMKARAKRTQVEAFDSMINERLWSDDRAQLKLWNLQ